MEAIGFLLHPFEDHVNHFAPFTLRMIPKWNTSENMHVDLHDYSFLGEGGVSVFSPGCPGTQAGLALICILSPGIKGCHVWSPIVLILPSGYFSLWGTDLSHMLASILPLS